MDFSGDLFHQMIESSQDGIWVFDASGRTLYSNGRTAELLGRTREELAGLTVADVLDEVGQQQLAAHLADLQERHAPNDGDVECTYRRPDGSPVPVMVGESVLRDSDGLPTAVIHRLSDDSERRELLAQLTSSEEQLAEAQAIAQLGSWDQDYITGKLTWSRQLYAIFGLDPVTFIPTREGFACRLVAADAPQVVAAITSAEKSGEPFGIDCRIVRSDGSLAWVRLLGRPVLVDGVLVRTSGTLQDISSIKEAELKLLDAVVLNMLMQMMATAANSATTLHDALEMVRGQLLAHDDWVRAVALAVRREGDEHVLAPYPLDPDDSEQVATDYETHVAQEVLRRGEMIFEEVLQPDNPAIGCMVRLDGEPLVVFVITNVSPFERHTMLTSMVEQVTAQLTQVAARERAAAELAEARDAAMEASRLKSEFLATMSHEIRTPLNGVIGLNELLLRTELDPQQRRLAGGMQVAGQSLLGLINDILDFSKIEAGELELERVDFEVRPVLEQVVAIVHTGASDKGLSVEVSVAHDVPDRVVGDPTRLGQVVSNLVSNAVKFTHAGGVQVRVRLEDEDEDALVLRVAVTDTGIGINEAQMSRLFEPFRQADASTTRTFGGTGLGLAISHQLVHALGGDLHATSTPGVGSTFWFTVRLGRAAQTRRVEPAHQATGNEREVESGRVLVVEDNDINQLVAQGLLEALGYGADIAENGAQAVSMAQAHDYVLILMDVQMPGMDGYTAARTIRADEPPGRRVPIVALTASAVIGERERCQEAGMDDLLTKPVNADRLGSVLRTYAGRARIAVATSASQAPSPEVLDPRRIEELAEMGERARSLVIRAVDNFVARSPGALTELRSALADKDAPALRAAAHQLRGSALNLGAHQAADVALELELMAEQEALAGCDCLLDQLAVSLDAAAAALTEYRDRRLLG